MDHLKMGLSVAARHFYRGLIFQRIGRNSTNKQLEIAPTSLKHWQDYMEAKLPCRAGWM